MSARLVVCLLAFIAAPVAAEVPPQGGAAFPAPIQAMIDDALAAELESAAAHWGLDVLIEVHEEAELERALKLRSRMIGINNRNLHTFETTLTTTERLAPMIPKDRMIVGESGLFTPADLARLARVNVNAFLIGESLMRQQDVTAATRTILVKPN